VAAGAVAGPAQLEAVRAASNGAWSKDELVMGDLAVLDGDALGAGSAFHWCGLGVVRDQRGFLVAEGSDHLRAGDNLHERAHESALRRGAFQAARWRVADDVVGDIAYGLVQVVVTRRNSGP